MDKEVSTGGNSARTLQRVAIAAFSIHLAVLLFLAFGNLPILGHRLIRDGAVLLLPLLTLPFAFRIRNRFSRFLGLITLTAAAGQVVWIVEKHGFFRLDEPSWATPFWMLGYVLVIVALVKWPARIARQASPQYALDALIIGTGFLAIAWVYLLGPKLLAPGGVALTSVFDVVYAAIDVAALVAIIQAIRRGVDPRFRTTTILGLIGLSALGFADLSEAFKLMGGRLGDDLTVLSWPFAATCANLAAFAYGLDERRPPVARDVKVAGIRWRTELPYLALLPVAALLVRVSADPALVRYELGVKVCAIMLTTCLGLRQYLALRDNERLVDKLQEAQSQLETKNEEISRTNDDLTDVLGRLTEKNQELAMANEQLARLVTVDGMTGLGNHRAFHERLRLEVDAARRFNHPLTVIIADLDHFRRYNDEFGHPAGDEVLRHVAKTLFDEVDLKAYPARYGGEEFAIVLPYFSELEAMEVAQRIGRAVASRVHLRRPITISFGIAGIQGNQWSAEILVQEAFRALDASKSRGRNQIVLAEDLDRRCLSLSAEDNSLSVYDPTEPMGLATILSAGLRSHPQALSIEPEIQLISGLLGTLELKDLETRDHSERVMWYALRLAQSVVETRVAKMTQQDLRSLAYGALLHDIGKIGVPEAILKFPGKLTEEMRNVIREHPRLGAQLVQKFPTLELALPVIRYHHERWDGGGYPTGKHSKEIPLVARIFAVVDALEALTSQRPYKDPVAIEDVTAILTRDAGTHFDPAIVEAYLAVPMAEWMRLREQERYVATTAVARAALPMPPG
ncbi:MAG: bifunctional diguanylate cyclase/phosphohydrolase [Fimbriimonas sp.]